MTERVVITGMGLVCGYGEDPCYSKERFWQGISSGENAIREWQPQGCDNFPVKHASSVDFERFQQDHKALLAQAPLLERRGYFGYVAAHLAYEDAGLSRIQNIGCMACSGPPDIDDDEMLSLEQLGDYPSNLSNYQAHKISGLCVANDSMVTAIAKHLEFNGPVTNINGACSGAAQALGMAYRAIRRGEVNVMLAGGADSTLNTRVMSGLFLLGATASNTTKGNKVCCPFDEQRSGFVATEGGAFLVLESLSSALLRGAKIYAELIGYGSSLDAYKVTAPHPEGVGAKLAMRAAVAGIDTSQVDYVNAHGTSTPLNDMVETLAIQSVFAGNQHYPLVSSTKSMIGHWISAAAAPEAIATVLALYHQLVPPTINLKKTDPESQLDYVPEPRSVPLHYALSNSFGFGGINASLLFKKYDA